MRQIAVFVILVIAVAIVKGQGAKDKEQMIEQMQGIAKECGNSLGFPGVVDKFNNGDFASISPEEKCIAKCIFQKLGICDGTGDVNMEAVEKLFSMDPENRDKYLECMNIKGPNDCETAFTVLQCTFAVCMK